MNSDITTGSLEWETETLPPIDLVNISIGNSGEAYRNQGYRQAELTGNSNSETGNTRQIECNYFLPSLTSSLALAFNIASSISCTFATRKFSSTFFSNNGNTALADLDLHLGLWTWRGLALTNDDDECYKYDDDQVQDGLIMSARAFSVISGIFGLCVLINSVFSAVKIKSFSRERRLLWTLLFFFAALLESFKFLVLSADICIDERLQESVVSYDDCQPSSGGYFCLTSIALWLCSSLSAFYAPSAK